MGLGWDCRDVVPSYHMRPSWASALVDEQRWQSARYLIRGCRALRGG